MMVAVAASQTGPAMAREVSTALDRPPPHSEDRDTVMGPRDASASSQTCHHQNPSLQHTETRASPLARACMAATSSHNPSMFIGRPLRVNS
eukprot:12313667-Alexandrium_andersonii.AAC.1